MTITHASLCFLVAVILFALQFLVGFANEAYGRYRIDALGWFFVSLGLLLAH